ncbi:uncharacterized protein LOC127477406 isoform X1 [Manacus candei]|uniref:uncharacterized protein LOC127477406 isoform X1 n=1 Tax=Manacus candei TaxID=415023 RepID=UPI00222651E7|nr:uncharacterized protein LOC127477406 isoform X1 [Manacus candei]
MQETRSPTCQNVGDLLILLRPWLCLGQARGQGWCWHCPRPRGLPEPHPGLCLAPLHAEQAAILPCVTARRGGCGDGCAGSERPGDGVQPGHRARARAATRRQPLAPPAHLCHLPRPRGSEREDTVNLPSIRGAVGAVGSHLKDQGLNLLINNAGVSSHATLRSVDPQEMLAVFATNVVGPLQVTKEFLPLLEQAAKGTGKEGLSCGRAAAINISTKLASLGLCLGVPEAPMYPYRASKAAQNMVTRCLAAELQDKGILCVAIHPGWVKTDMGTEKVLGCTGEGQQNPPCIPMSWGGQGHLGDVVWAARTISWVGASREQAASNTASCVSSQPREQRGGSKEKYPHEHCGCCSQAAHPLLCPRAALCADHSPWQ